MIEEKVLLDSFGLPYQISINISDKICGIIGKTTISSELPFVNLLLQSNFLDEDIGSVRAD